MKRLIAGVLLMFFAATSSVGSAQQYDFDATSVRLSTDNGCQFYFIMAFTGQGGGFLDKAGKHLWHWTPQSGVGCKEGELISGTGTLTDNGIKFVQGTFVKGLLEGQASLFLEANSTPSPTAQAGEFHLGCPTAPGNFKCAIDDGSGVTGQGESPGAIENRMWANCGAVIRHTSTTLTGMSADSAMTFLSNLVSRWAAYPDSSLPRRAEIARIAAATGVNAISVRFTACLIGERLGAGAAKEITDAIVRTSESLVIEQRMRSACVTELGVAAQWNRSFTPPRTQNFDAMFRTNSASPDSLVRRNRNALRARQASEVLNASSLLSLCMMNVRLGLEKPEQVSRAVGGDSRQLTDMLSSCSAMVEPAISQQVAIGASRPSELTQIRGLASTFAEMTSSEIARELERWAGNTYHDPVSDLRRCLQNRRRAQLDGSVPGLGGVSSNSGQTMPSAGTAPPTTPKAATPLRESAAGKAASQPKRNNSTAGATANYRFSVPSVPNCAKYEQLPRRLVYDAYQMTNTCSFGIIGKLDFYFSGQRYYNNDGGFALLPGKAQRIEFLNSSPRQPWYVSYATCPDKAEMTRRTGRRVASITFATDGKCFGVFEPDPQGIIN